MLLSGTRGSSHEAKGALKLVFRVLSSVSRAHNWMKNVIGHASDNIRNLAEQP